MSRRRLGAILGSYLLFLAVGGAGCGPVAGGGEEDAGVGSDSSTPIDSTLPHTLAAILVTPTNTIVEVDLDSPTSQAFTATGSYLDGVNEDMTDHDFVPQTGEAQLFRAVIRVLAGGCTDLDQREVFILVPPDPVVVN